MQSFLENLNAQDQPDPWRPSLTLLSTLYDPVSDSEGSTSYGFVPRHQMLQQI